MKGKIKKIRIFVDVNFEQKKKKLSGKKPALFRCIFLN